MSLSVLSHNRNLKFVKVFFVSGVVASRFFSDGLSLLFKAMSPYPLLGL